MQISISAGLKKAKKKQSGDAPKGYVEAKAAKAFKVKDKEGNELTVKKGESFYFRNFKEDILVKDLIDHEFTFRLKESTFKKYVQPKKETKLPGDKPEKKQLKSEKETLLDSIKENEKGIIRVLTNPRYADWESQKIVKGYQQKIEDAKNKLKELT